MKKSRALLLGLLLLTTAAPGEPARSLINSLHTAIIPSEAAARRSIDDLRDLSKELPELKFVAPERANELSPGQSMPVVIVDLDHLRVYDPVAQPDATALLVPTDRAFHFVSASNETEISGVEVMKDGSEWVPARLGLTIFAADVQTTLNRLDLTANDAILIEIPAFRLWFVGYDKGGIMNAAAIENAPELDIEKNVGRPLGAVLRSLVKPAREHNGMPS